MKIFIASILGLALTFSLATPSFAASTRSLEDIASFIGISTETLIEELNSGMNMSEIAEAYGVDPRAVRNYINASSNSNFATLLADDEFAEGLAELVGISVETLCDLMTNGYGLEGLSEDYGVEMVDLKAYVAQAFEDAGIETSYESSLVR